MTKISDLANLYPLNTRILSIL